MSEDNETRGTGFEFRGRFYRLHVSDIGKDLMLIDRISGLPLDEFFQLMDDEHARARGPIMLTLIATSLRHGNPEWSVERITKTVMDLSISDDIEFIGADDEEAEEGPLAGESSESPTPASADAPSSSTPNGSLPSSIRAEPMPSEMWSESLP